MTAYFIDTWFLVALFDATDSDHRRAIRISRAIGKSPLVTHDGVLTEFLTFIADEGSRVRARGVRVVRDVLRQRTVVEPNRTLFLRAVDLYDDRPGKGYSLTDCMSMVVMRDRGIEHVLTNDRHFAQEGFVVLSDAP